MFEQRLNQVRQREEQSVETQRAKGKKSRVNGMCSRPEIYPRRHSGTLSLKKKEVIYTIGSILYSLQQKMSKMRVCQRTKERKRGSRLLKRKLPK